MKFITLYNPGDLVCFLAWGKGKSRHSRTVSVKFGIVDKVKIEAVEGKVKTDYHIREYSASAGVRGGGSMVASSFSFSPLPLTEDIKMTPESNVSNDVRALWASFYERYSTYNIEIDNTNDNLARSFLKMENKVMR